MGWEYPTFAVVAICFSGVQYRLIYRHYQKIKQQQGTQNKQSKFITYLTVLMILFMLSSLYGGWFFVQYWESKAKQEMKFILDGVGPTFAYELKRMGHAGISMGTPGDDSAYLEMIHTMVDWMTINPLIQSIYTFRKTPQGDVVFVLGPETDYDHDGVIEGEKEARVPIGTVYQEIIPEIEAAFNGRYSFQEEPMEDKWSYCVSVFVPIGGEYPDGPEAILGIDFDGTSWNAAIRLERMKAIGLVVGILVLINTLYLAFCHYWFDLQKTRQQELDQEIAHLERLNLIGEIAASIGHEVRNPMTTVRGFLQIFHRKKEFAQYQDNLDLMIEELDRANSILTEFLSLAKNKRVDFKPCSLSEVLRIIKPILDTEALLKGHNLVMHMGHTPTFPMDTNEIRQLILNLVRNGLEAMEDHGRITITTYTENNQACLEISDEGKGIAEQVFHKLGTPFLTTKEHGTGLGLAVCFRIAEHHKAKIEVTTGLGGTTFFVRFPLV